MSIIQKMLTYLHRVFDKDPQRMLAMRVAHTDSLTWTILDGQLVIQTADDEITADLSEYTLDELRIFLDAQAGISIPYFDATIADRSALILMDGAGDQDESNGDHFYVYTSLLWAFAGAYGTELRLIRSCIELIPDQMSVPASRGEWLEYLGEWMGMPRLTGEDDDTYSRRIIADIIKPRCNNVAIQDALATKFGLALSQVKVLDAPLAAYAPIVPASGHTHHYCEFDIELEPPFDGIDPYDMPPFVKPLRVHGTRLRRIVTILPSAVPKTAAWSPTGETTMVQPFIASEISASGPAYTAPAVLVAEISTVYPGSPS